MTIKIRIKNILESIVPWKRNVERLFAVQKINFTKTLIFVELVIIFLLLK